MTAVMHAIEDDNIEALKILLKNKVETELTDYSGKTLFDYVKNSRNTFIKKLVSGVK